MLGKIVTILLYSRVFSSPTTILSWLVIFTYSIIDSGNILFGLLCLVGMCLVHFGTNLLDDYFDYKVLIKQVNYDKTEYLKISQKTKCRYIINGSISENELLIIICVYFFCAALIGLFLYLQCGSGVINYVIAAAIIVLLYPLASRFMLSEIFVGAAYGPVLFGGVYYVMCGTYSKDVFFLSIPTLIMTVVLLYIHTVMDYEFDLNEGKRTVANHFDSRLEALKVLKILLIIAYISPIVLCILDILDWQAFLVYLTIPMAIDLYKSMIEYACNPNSIPEHRWYHYPMENMKSIKAKNEESFMIRMYQARNLMMYFSILLVISIVLSLSI